MLRKPASLKNQTLLLVVVWTLSCVKTAFCSDGCGILTGQRLVPVSSNRTLAVSVSINCTASKKGDLAQTLEFLIDTSSLVNFSSLTNDTVVDLCLTFNQSVTISTEDLQQRFHATNGGSDEKHVLTGRLSGRPDKFTVVGQGNGGMFAIQRASVQVRTNSVRNYESPQTVHVNLTATTATTETVTSSSASTQVFPVCQDSSDIAYIVGLAATSIIAVVSVVISVLLYLKLRASRSHHYVKPLPIDHQAIRPPAKSPPVRSQSEPELLGATARASIAYDYAFVDGPPLTVSPRRNSDLDIPNGKAGNQKSADIIIKRPLHKTRSISEPILLPPGSGGRSKQSKPQPPPKTPKVLAMRKVSSADQIDESAVYDDPHSPTRCAPVNESRIHTKPIPSPRSKKPVTPNKGATTRSTTSDGYLRPVDKPFTQKSNGGQGPINGTTYHHAIVDMEESLYVPMDSEQSVVDEDCYIPMRNLGPHPSSDCSPSGEPQQPAVKCQYENVEEWLDNTEES